MDKEEARLANRTLVRKNILDQASALLTEEGPQALSMRKLSQKLCASTIVLYTYFRNKEDILNELYQEGFERLRQDLAAVPADDDAMAYVMALGRAYRHSAVSNPTYYQIMFSRCVPGFNPSAESRETSKQAFAILAGGVQAAIDRKQIPPGDAAEIAQVLWGTLHGIISLELFGYLMSAEIGELRLEQAMQVIKSGFTHHLDTRKTSWLSASDMHPVPSNRVTTRLSSAQAWVA